MSQSENSELMDLIGRTWDQMGGRGTKAEVVAHLRVALPPHLTDYLVKSGIDAKVGGFFRRKNDDGLPQAPEIDEHGTHAQLELIDVHEYRYIIARQMDNSLAARKRALALAAKCEEVHGVHIDIHDPYGEAEAV